MLESISLAFQNVWRHKLRSFLTMLGIIIGIASIITIVSTIKGTNEQIKESLVGAGNNAVVVQLYQDNYPYEVQYNGVPAGVYPITEETRQELCKIDHVKGVSLFCSRNYADGVYYGNNSFSGNLQRDEQGDPLSPRRHEGHGQGIKAMRRVAEQYNSVLIIETQDNLFHVKSYLYFQKDPSQTEA